MLLAASCCTGSLSAQIDSRAGEIAAEQQQKAAQLSPVRQGRIERGLLWLREKEMVERFLNGASGVHPKFGGLAPEGGAGLGGEYRWANRQFTFHTSAVASFGGSRKFDLELAAPKLANSRLFAELYAAHNDYSRLSYYGSGPDSEKSDRVRYHLEDTAVDGRLGVRPFRYFSLGPTAGYVSTHVRPGADSSFGRLGGFAQYDWRDNPGGPRRGGNYFAQFSDYRKFRRLDVEAQQFVSILNQRRVFALRAKSALTFKEPGQEIPFYMQPTLGSSDDLRGYRPYRFRGDNLLVMNAEYRWEVFSGLDMALFTDAGKVFTRKSDFNLHKLESDAGFGFRFNARNKTFLRADVGFSHEGFQIWIKFKNAFQKGPIHTSSGMGDY
jgi:hypothetical protein